MSLLPAEPFGEGTDPRRRLLGAVADPLAIQRDQRLNSGEGAAQERLLPAGALAEEFLS